MSYPRSFWETWVQEHFFFPSLRTALLLHGALYRWGCISLAGV